MRPRLGVAVLAGVALALAFPPYDLWPLAFVVLASSAQAREDAPKVRVLIVVEAI